MEKHDARLNIQNENRIVEMGDREIEGGGGGRSFCLYIVRI